MNYTVTERTLNIKIDSLYCETIQDFFDSYIPSRKVQHLLIQNKQIRMDGNPVKREDEICGMELNICLYPTEHEYRKTEAEQNLEIVYEDELILVVSKPKDLLVHDDGNGEDCLSRWVESYYAEQNWISAIPIHRLDKGTTGLVVFSKSEVFQPLLDKLLAEKQIRRSYLAFCEGVMEEGETRNLNGPIAKDRHDPKKRIVHKTGQPALTKIRCLGSNRKHNYSIVRCVLDTGRTHQIRVHLADIRHPILNDDLYGHPSSLCIRMGLLADELEFYHPLKEEIISIEGELPNDLSKLYGDTIR